MKRITLAHLLLFLLLPILPVLAQNTTFEGTADYHDIWEVEGVMVYLVDNTTGNIIDSTITDSTGHYEFLNLPNGDYSVNALANAPVGGIDILDALEVIHYLHPNSNSVWTPLQEMAADMNKDGNVSHVDAVKIIQHWVYTIIKGWGNNKNGEEEGEDIEFLNEMEDDTSSGTGTDTTYVESDGSKRGDVDGSYSPGKKPSDFIYLNTEGTLDARSGEMITIPVRVSQITISSGFGIGIGFNSSALQIVDVTTPINGAQIDICANKVLITWFNENAKASMLSEGQLLMEIKAIPRHGFDNAMVSLYSTPGSILVDGERKSKQSAFLTVPEIHIYEGTARFSAHYPNPSANYVKFPVRLKHDAVIEYEVFDISGKSVISCPASLYTKGDNLIESRLDALKSGMYTFQFEITNMDGRIEQISKTVIID